LNVLIGMQTSLVKYSFCLYKVIALPDMYGRRDAIRTTMLSRVRIIAFIFQGNIIIIFYEYLACVDPRIHF